MHVVGAKFDTSAKARAALAAVQESVTPGAGEAGVRPLGSTRYDEPTEEFILAGRFDDSQVDAVIEIIERHGGTLLERRVEAPTAGGAPQWRPQPSPMHARPARTRPRRPVAPVRGRAARSNREVGRVST